MKTTKLHLIFSCVLFFCNSIIAQKDSSAYESIMARINYFSKVDTVTTFLINETGETIKIDTVKRYYLSKRYNKIYYIIRNDTLCEEMIYDKNKLSFVDFYVKGKNIKRMIYSLRRPYHLMKIVYFDMREGREEREKIEYYDKNGEMIKVVYGSDPLLIMPEKRTKHRKLWKLIIGTQKGSEK